MSVHGSTLALGCKQRHNTLDRSADAKAISWWTQHTSMSAAIPAEPLLIMSTRSTVRTSRRRPPRSSRSTTPRSRGAAGGAGSSSISFTCDPAGGHFA